MRGKVWNLLIYSTIPGTTPAYAGKSKLCSAMGSNVRDHPRLCGEKGLQVLGITSNRGSPPPMRGKDKSKGFKEWQTGITPAYAGKSNTVSGKKPLNKDHPRLCGEKSDSLTAN